MGDDGTGCVGCSRRVNKPADGEEEEEEEDEPKKKAQCVFPWWLESRADIVLSPC